MAEFNDMPLDTGALLADCLHLSAQERGAYVWLLVAMWRTRDVRLKLDDIELSRISGLSLQAWKRIRPRIFELPGWELDYTDPQNARFTHKKLEQIRTRVRISYDQKVEAGRARQRTKRLI